MPPDRDPADHDLLARLLYRDGLVLIIDKPAGVPVHGTPGGGPALDERFEALRFGLPRPPALAHRLDRDTSGCLVLGRHRKALARLGRLFAENRVEKTYWALVRGAPPEPAGRIDLALAKPERGRVVPDPSGSPAITDYRLRAAADGLAWLELRPVTGRTHQLRVHCAALGCPVLGDRLYGQPGPATPPLQLHARAVRIPLYPKRTPIETAAPLPAHMTSVFAQAGIAAADEVAMSPQRSEDATERLAGKDRDPHGPATEELDGFSFHTEDTGEAQRARSERNRKPISESKRSDQGTKK